MVIGWQIKMASAKQIAWRKKFAKLYGKKKAGSKLNPKVKSNPHNDDGYYIVKEGSLFVLRQKRFKDRLDRGKKEHPHDVMAYGRTRAEINRMKKMITKS